jgi:hypothetical protein
MPSSEKLEIGGLKVVSKSDLRGFPYLSQVDNKIFPFFLGFTFCMMDFLFY